MKPGSNHYDDPHYGPSARAEFAHARIDAISDGLKALAAAVSILNKQVALLQARQHTDRVIDLFKEGK